MCMELAESPCNALNRLNLCALSLFVCSAELERQASGAAATCCCHTAFKVDHVASLAGHT